MEKKEKGMYGYIEYHKKIQLIKTIIMFLLVLLVYFTGILATKTRENVLTVVAIVGVLPSAKMLVSYIVLFKYKSPDRERYNELNDISRGGVVLSDCVITCTDKRFYIEFAYVTDTCIYCFTENKPGNYSTIEANIEEFIKKCGDYVKVNIIDDFEKFKSRVRTAEIPENKRKKIERVYKDFLILVM